METSSPVCGLVQMSVEQIRHRAVLILGSEPAAVYWLSRPHPALGGHPPDTLLATACGRQQLVILLTRQAAATYS